MSVLVALLTILRLYAILRALTFYRHLRRVNDRQSLISMADGQLQHQMQPGPSMEGKQLVWAAAPPPPQPIVFRAARPGSISMQPHGSLAPSGRAATRPSSYAGQRHRKAAVVPLVARARSSTLSRARRTAPERRQQGGRGEACATPPPAPPPAAEATREPALMVMKAPRGERPKAHSDADESHRPLAEIGPAKLQELLASLDRDQSCKSKGDRIAAGSYTILSGGGKSATLGKYRLVARYRPVMGALATGATTASRARSTRGRAASSTPLDLIEEYGAVRRSSAATSDLSAPSSSTSSSDASEGSTCGPDDSDHSSARLSLRRAAKTRSLFANSPLSALCQTEELIADNLRAPRVFELAPTAGQPGAASAGNTLLLGKCK